VQPIEAQGITIHCKNKQISIINTYIKPGIHIDNCKLENLISNIPEKHYILCGDCNAHNTSWNSDFTSVRGRIIEDWCTNNTLVILDPINPTHYNTKNGHQGKTSTIDLSITSTALGLITECESDDRDALGSDHYPVHTTVYEQPIISDIIKPKMYNLSKANWPEYKGKLKDTNITGIPHPDTNQFCINYTKLLIDTANKTIPKTSGKPKSHNAVPWWNEECAEIIRIKNRAHDKFRRTKSTQDFERFKQARLNSKEFIKTTKEKNWDNFVTKINPKTTSRNIWSQIKRI
jgi:hypothetical protein